MDRILTFFINTNVIVSIAALCLYKVTEIIIGIRNPALSLFVFSATLFAYNYMRLPFYAHIKLNKRNTWLNQHQRIIYIVLFFAFILIIYALSILGLRLKKGLLSHRYPHHHARRRPPLEHAGHRA